MVSVWAVSQKLSIAQVAVDSKSNEITSDPRGAQAGRTLRSGRDDRRDGLSDRDRPGRSSTEAATTSWRSREPADPTHVASRNTFSRHLQRRLRGWTSARSGDEEKGHGRVSNAGRTTSSTSRPTCPAAGRWKRAEADRRGDQRRDPRRQAVRRRAVLHPEQDTHGPADSARWREATWGIGRTSSALAARHELRRGPKPKPARDHAGRPTLAVLRRIALSLLKNEASSKVGVESPPDRGVERRLSA